MYVRRCGARILRSKRAGPNRPWCSWAGSSPQLGRKARFELDRPRFYQSYQMVTGRTCDCEGSVARTPALCHHTMGTTGHTPIPFLSFLYILFLPETKFLNIILCSLSCFGTTTFISWVDVSCPAVEIRATSTTGSGALRRIFSERRITQGPFLLGVGSTCTRDVDWFGHVL